MAGLVLAKRALPSRAVRVTATGNKGGLRRIDPNAQLVDSKGKGFLSRGKQFAGFVLQALGWTIDSASDLWEVTRDVFDTVWFFDFNITAGEQLNRLKADAEAILLQLAGMAGASVGWVTVAALGMGVATYIPVVGGVMLAGMVRNAVIQEAVQDLLARLTAIGMSATRIALNQTLTWGWIGFRNLWRVSTRAASRGIAAARGGDTLKRLNEYYKAQDAQPYTFQKGFRDRIEKLPDFIQGVVEAAIDDFQDIFWEGGYVVANEIDRAYQLRDQSTDLSIKPDAGSDERFYLYGSQQQVMQQTHQLLQQHRTLANRDVGYVVGDTDLPGRAATSQKTLKIFYFPYDNPPWRRNRATTKTISCQFVLKDLKQGISWEELKAACVKFSTGSVRTTAFLGNGRQMSILASTEREGQQKLIELASLLTTDIQRFSSGTQTLVAQKRLSKAPSSKKPEQLRPIQLMYPAYAYFFINIKWVDGKDGHPAIPDGVAPGGDAYFTRKTRFNLYPTLKPKNYPLPL